MMKSAKPIQARNKQEIMLDLFHDAIVKRELKGGTRLPIRTELEEKFGVSRMTVQKVLDRLTKDGFIRSRGHLGTFIVDHPPCLHRYGVVFPDDPDKSSWGGYHDALQMVAQEFNQPPECEIACYYSVERVGSGDYDKLLHDIESSRLAGILYSTGPWNYQKSPVVTQKRIPSMFVTWSAKQHPHLDTITVDRAQLFDKAVETLAAKGCTRPAILIGAGYTQALPQVQNALRARGISYDPALLQGVQLQYPELAEHVTRLWMQLPKPLRPDGLFVADDNLAEWACSGLLHAGIRTNEDLPVLVSSNFPVRVGADMNVDRIGYNMRDILRYFIGSANAAHGVQPPPPSARIDAVLEKDLQDTAPPVPAGHSWQQA